MNPTLRHAWTEVISADDIDEHMHKVGQAQANAQLTAEMLAAARLAMDSRVLIAGAGTAQFLDYIEGEGLADFDLTVSDINPRFLALARQRFRRAGLMRTHFVVDDLEATRLRGPFDAALIVLVLEHIDWRLGLRNVHSLMPRQLLIVIQQNPAGSSQAITRQRKLNASMQAFAETASPTLIVAEELMDYLGDMGYKLMNRHERAVPDGKTMLAMIFSNDRPESRSRLASSGTLC